MARSRKAIINDICDTYASLSPENLSCDGELSVKETAAEEKRLNTRLEALFKELGERPSEMVAYDELERLAA